MESKPNSPSFASVRREAGSVLAGRETRLVLIEAILVTFVMGMLYGILQSVATLAAGSVGDAQTTEALIFVGIVIAIYLLLILLVTLFLTLPLIFGILFMAGRAVQNEEITLSMLFFPFSAGRRYLCALGFSWGILWRFLLAVLLITLTWSIPLAFFGTSVVVVLVCVVLTVLETVLLFWLGARRFFTLAAVVGADLSWRGARRAVRGLPNVRCQLSFLLRFVPWFLLGILTVGILLLWDVLPRMAVTYFCYAKRINEMNMIRSEDDTNE